ncbi:MAG: M14 family metallopeptidase [Isosphaeraceae bacterium]
MLALGLWHDAFAAGAGQDPSPRAAAARPADAPAAVQGPVKPPRPLPTLAIATDPRVPIAFNRLYDYPELTALLKKLVAAYPDLLSLQSLGKSTEGRDLWCVTINNPATGDDRSKPAMYVDGNIHGNEIQGAEVALYLIWYLAENRGRNEVLRKLTDERAFYVVPTINPDGRAYWFNAPNTTHSSRSGKSPLDDDQDGVADEDGLDDLNGDGQITQMRRRDPDGPFKVSPEDPRLLVRIRPGEEVHGERYELLGMEGIDNDGDGRINEDPPGGYDMNRNWPADWQPDELQGGAGNYPLCWPETRAVARFLRDHPNVAGVQAFHNAAGMILRGPGHASRQGEYPAEDEQVAGEIGRVGARMLPFYRSLVIHRDLYNVHGGFIGWAYEHLGIFSFTNELWNNDQLLGRAEPPAAGQALARAVGATDQAEQLFASDRLLFGAQFVPWTRFKHPLHGDVELGGFVKQSQRVPPSFMIEELCHRNAAFAIYHAEQMPRLEWDRVDVQKLGGPPDSATSVVTASVRNTRSIPTRARQAVQRKLGLPDQFTIAGPGLKVAGGGLLVDRDTGEVEPVEHQPEVIRLDSGIPGGGVARARWYVQGKGKASVSFRAQKGGTLTRTLELP